MKYILITILAILMTSCSSVEKKDVGLAHYIGMTPLVHGTSFKIDYKDYIITAEHVCSNNLFILVNGTVAPVVYKNKEHDFCVLDGSDVKGLKKLPFTMNKVKNNQKIEVVGYPTTYISAPNYSQGRVIGLEIWPIMYKDGMRPILIYTVNAPTFPGNSGGPVLRNGFVIGVLVAGDSKTHFGAFIPIRRIIKIMKRVGL